MSGRIERADTRARAWCTRRVWCTSMTLLSTKKADGNRWADRLRVLPSSAHSKRACVTRVTETGGDEEGQRCSARESSAQHVRRAIIRRHQSKAPPPRVQAVASHRRPPRAAGAACAHAESLKGHARRDVRHDRRRRVHDETRARPVWHCRRNRKAGCESSATARGAGRKAMWSEPYLFRVFS
jgi:hypothetical protein